MIELEVDLNTKSDLVFDTIDFIDLANNPIKSVLILRSEMALFQGSKNRAEEFTDNLTRGINASPDILPEFLEKTLGIGYAKIEDVFIGFNMMFNKTSKEMKYFGNLMLSDVAQSKLVDYIDNPSDSIKQQDFLHSLADIVNKSQDKVDEEYDAIIKFSNQVIEEVLS